MLLRCSRCRVVAKPTGTNPANRLDYLNDNGTNNSNTFADKNLVSHKMYKLNVVTNRTGLSKMLKVMAGDKVSILARSYYRYAGGTVTNTPFSTTDLINGFLAVAGGVNPATQHGATSAILNADPALLTPLNSFTNTNPVNGGNNVKAAVNYIILDEHFKYVSGNFDPVQSAAAGGIKSHFLQDIPIPKNGYIYIYCSNESNIDVFFDNLEVVHTRGPLLEETQYYPFGLTMAGISSKALGFGGSENRYKYNKGSELQNKEFSDGSGLETYDTHFRQLDPQIGRWWQIDPKPEYAQSLYSSMSNNPVSYNDPLGDKINVEGSFFERIKVRSTLLFASVFSRSARGVIRQLRQSQNIVTIKVVHSPTVIDPSTGLKVNNQNSTTSNSRGIADSPAGYVTVDPGGLTVGTGTGKGTGSNVKWDLNATTSGADLNGQTKRPKYIGLLHELLHAYQIDLGTIRRNVSANGVRNSEAEAVQWENKFRSQLGLFGLFGLTPRRDYRDAVSGNPVNVYDLKFKTATFGYDSNQDKFF